MPKTLITWTINFETKAALLGRAILTDTTDNAAGLSTFSTLYQFGFEGDLVFRLPQATN